MAIYNIYCGGEIRSWDLTEREWRKLMWRSYYWGHTYFLFEKPKQFRKESEFYYATLDWREMDFDGHKYWRADIPATDDHDSDYDKAERAERYLRLSKLKWKVLTADQISPVHRMPNGEATDSCGKIVLDVWLRDHMVKFSAVC